MYYDSLRNTTLVPMSGIGEKELIWLEQQLSENSDRKFIILDHVYAGSRYQSFSLWADKPTKTYFDILRKYKDRVIVEVGGHDHFSSVRYHSTKNVFDLPDPEGERLNFHNLIIAPSFTPWYRNNPAVSVMEIDEQQIPRNFRSTYWNLGDTIGDTQVTPYEDLEFRDLDYKEAYGLDELTPNAIQMFAVQLGLSPVMQNDYMIRKIGLDPQDPEEVEISREVFMDKGLITKISKRGGAPLYSLWPQICLMASNISVSEYAACLAKDPETHIHGSTVHADKWERMIDYPL